MDFAWFLYTILIIIVAVTAAVSCVTVWVLTNRKDCLVAAATFIIYTLEQAGILFDEYMRNKPVMEELFTSGLTHPFVNITLGVALVTCIWLWVALHVYAPVRKQHVLMFAGVYLVLAVLLAPVASRASVVRTVVYWSLRDVLVIGAVVFAWYWRTFKAREAERLSLDRAKRFWQIALALSCLVLVEDILTIMFVRPNLQDQVLHGFFWHLTERNLSDNVLMVVCAAKTLLYNRDLMAIFARHPMEETVTGEQREGTARNDFDSRLLRFADDHGMSKREREVLALALGDKSVQGIANELFISDGTVKAHLHRIYSKAGVENRQALIKAFWTY